MTRWVMGIAGIVFVFLGGVGAATTGLGIAAGFDLAAGILFIVVAAVWLEDADS